MNTQRSWPELPPGARSRRGAGLRRVVRGLRRRRVLTGRRIGCAVVVAGLLALAGLAVLDRAGDAVASLWRPDPVAGSPFDPVTSSAPPTTGSDRIDTITARGALIVAVQEAPSLVVRDPATREYFGFDVALVELVARDLGVDPARTSYKPLPAASREQALVRGDVDLVVGGYEMTPERAAEVAFAGPYLQSRVRLAVPAASTATGLDTVDGQVCAARGSPAEVALAGLGSRLVTRAGIGACVDLLGAGVEAVAADEAALADLVGPDGLRLAGEPLATAGYGIGLAPGDPVLRERLQEVLRRAVADGTWARLHAEHLGNPVPEPPPLDR